MLLVGLGREAGFVIHFAFQRSGAQIKRIGGREANFDDAAVILQAINSVGQKFAGEQNIAGGGLRVDVIAVNIGETEVSADGGNLKFSGAAQRTEKSRPRS